MLHGSRNRNSSPNSSRNQAVPLHKDTPSPSQVASMEHDDLTRAATAHIPNTGAYTPEHSATRHIQEELLGYCSTTPQVVRDALRKNGPDNRTQHLTQPSPQPPQGLLLLLWRLARQWRHHGCWRQVCGGHAGHLVAWCGWRHVGEAGRGRRHVGGGGRRGVLRRRGRHVGRRRRRGVAAARTSCCCCRGWHVGATGWWWEHGALTLQSTCCCCPRCVTTLLLQAAAAVAACCSCCAAAVGRWQAPGCCWCICDNNSTRQGQRTMYVRLTAASACL
jgi:hypothetical protein